jgi:hypothetical protein
VTPDGREAGPDATRSIACALCSAGLSVREERAVAHACGAVFGLRPMGTCRTQQVRRTAGSRWSRRVFVDHAIESADGGAYRWFYVGDGTAFDVREGDAWGILFGMAEVRHAGWIAPRITLRPRLLRLVDLSRDGPGQEILPAAGVPPSVTAEAIGLVDDALPRLDADGPPSSATTRQIARARRVGRR